MAMVQAVCVDGPREGAVVWMADANTSWTTSSLLRGYTHYRVAGRTVDPVHGPSLRLEYAGRSRSRVVRLPDAAGVPAQRRSGEGRVATA